MRDKWKKRSNLYAIGVESGDADLVDEFFKCAFNAGMSKLRAIGAMKAKDRKAAMGFFAAQYRAQKRSDVLRHEILRRLEDKSCTKQS